MKKLIHYLSLFALALMVILAIPASEAKAGTTSAGLKFTCTDGTAKITGYSGTSSTVTIPADIDGNPVTSIGSSAFEGNTTIKEIKFASGSKVKTLGDYAFEDCTNLVSVTLPASVTDMGGRTFYGCKSLTTINIPDGVTVLDCDVYGIGVFQDCTSLKSIHIPSGVTEIRYGAFCGCTSLSQVNIPANLTVLEGRAFQGTAITGITIPDGITSIGDYEFYGCKYLEKVVLNDNIKKIGDQAFCGCANLKSINIPADLEKISYNVFKGCTSLTSLKFGNNISSLDGAGDGIFYNHNDNLVVKVVRGSKMYYYCLNNDVKYEIYASDFCGCQFSGITDKTYTGSAITQKIKVTNGQDNLVEGTDYTVTYSDNVNCGTATMLLKGIGKYAGNHTETFKIGKADISNAKVTLSKSVYTYSANTERKPTVKVVWNKKTVASSDYYVSYTCNRSVGRAKVTVTGTNNFQGNIIKYFKIVPGKTKITAASNTGKGIKLKWKRVPIATGYIIYRNGKKIQTISSNYASSKYVTYVDTSAKKLANGKKCKYKVYAYSGVYIDGKYVHYKSEVSNTKTIKKK